MPYMLVTVGESGVDIQFFATREAVMTEIFGTNGDGTLAEYGITRFLAAEQAAGSPMEAWRDGDAFLAEVTLLTMEPEQVVTRYRIAEA